MVSIEAFSEIISLPKPKARRLFAGWLTREDERGEASPLPNISGECFQIQYSKLDSPNEKRKNFKKRSGERKKVAGAIHIEHRPTMIRCGLHNCPAHSAFFSTLHPHNFVYAASPSLQALSRSTCLTHRPCSPFQIHRQCLPLSIPSSTTEGLFLLLRSLLQERSLPASERQRCSSICSWGRHIYPCTHLCRLHTSIMSGIRSQRTRHKPSGLSHFRYVLALPPRTLSQSDLLSSGGLLTYPPSHCLCSQFSPIMSDFLSRKPRTMRHIAALQQFDKFYSSGDSDSSLHELIDSSMMTWENFNTGRQASYPTLTITLHLCLGPRLPVQASQPAYLSLPQQTSSRLPSGRLLTDSPSKACLEGTFHWHNTSVRRSLPSRSTKLLPLNYRLPLVDCPARATTSTQSRLRRCYVVDRSAISTRSSPKVTATSAVSMVSPTICYPFSRQTETLTQV